MDKTGGLFINSDDPDFMCNLIDFLNKCPTKDGYDYIIKHGFTPVHKAELEDVITHIKDLLLGTISMGDSVRAALEMVQDLEATHEQRIIPQPNRTTT